MSGIVILQLEAHTWEDERGWGARPMEAAGLAGKTIGDVHVVSMNPGKVRGNHVHDGTEWLLVFGGKLEIRSRPSDDAEVRMETVDEEKPVLLEIPPGVRHSFKNVGGKTMYLLAFSDREKLVTTRAVLG